MSDNVNQTTARVPHQGTRAVLFLVFAAFVSSIIFAVTSLMFKLTLVPFSTNVALVLLTFGLFKISIAMHAIMAPTAVLPQSDQRQDTGSPTIFRLWVGYKLVPAALAIVSAFYLLIAGAPALDALVK
jgi:uncharacterized membrane protein YvlD (DUF360 family)